jgi:hypothetical protein
MSSGARDTPDPPPGKGIPSDWIKTKRRPEEEKIFIKPPSDSNVGIRFAHPNLRAAAQITP